MLCYIWFMQTPSPEDMYRLLIPAEILEHFEISGLTERETDITVVLTEKASNIPVVLHGKEVVLNGFLNKLELQGFPIQAKSFYLQLIRRRWKEQGSSEASYHNEYDFAAAGTKATKAFGAFLKDNF